MGFDVGIGIVLGRVCRMVLGWVGLRSRQKRLRCSDGSDVRRASSRSHLVEVEGCEEVEDGWTRIDEDRKEILGQRMRRRDTKRMTSSWKV